MKLTAGMVSLAKACAREVYLPPSAGCCGFAGDRGLIHPELTQSATQAESQEVRAMTAQSPGSVHCYSSSRTCELGLSIVTGNSYRSIWDLMERASRGS
jgi:D-lactate dehydrogenase